MKKFLPIILLLIGLLVVGSAYFFVSRNNDETVDNEQTEEVALLNVPLSERPVVTLTPRSDGYWLDMTITKLTIEQAETMDYELLYSLPDGRQQGVPGMVDLSGREQVDTELLLGSESNGRFRYDEGVENGTMTLRFRNDEGKLLAKFVAEFHLQTNTDNLTSSDGNFIYELEDTSSEFFVTMNTVGYPEGLPIDTQNEPYGVFTSAEEEMPGNIDLSGSVYRWDGEEWLELQSSESEDVGIFVN